MLQQPQLGCGTPAQHGAQVQYGVLVSYGAATMTVTNVELNRDNIPDVLHQPQISCATPVQFSALLLSYAAPAPVQHGAPVTHAAAPTITITGVHLNTHTLHLLLWVRHAKRRLRRLEQFFAIEEWSQLLRLSTSLPPDKPIFKSQSCTCPTPCLASDPDSQQQVPQTSAMCL